MGDMLKKAYDDSMLDCPEKPMTSKSCCDKAIDEGTLIHKGWAEWVCPTCGKNQMLKLVFMHDAGLEYKPGKGLKATKRKTNDK